MTIDNPIKCVSTKLEVSLPVSIIQGTRDMSDGMPDYSDEDILKALGEDILERYFNTAYFDFEAIVQSLG